MQRKYFGTDGVRGAANELLTPELALRIGQAAGAAFRESAVNRRVVIGKDTRISGYMIETALVAGFTSIGMNVLQLGPMPSPAVAMLTRAMRADLGVMISASHNPFMDNGIKLFGPDGYKLSDVKEMEIEARMSDWSPTMLARSRDLGRAKRIDGVRARYVEFVKSAVPRDLSLEGLRVVIDCANGAGYKVAPEALWELGAEVIAIGVEPNGVNINQDVGSTAPHALQRKVLEMRADIGIALDGDADRVLVVDEKGDVVDGDQILALIAETLQASNRLTKAGIVTTIMANGGLETHLASKKLGLIRTPVGDRYVIERMRAENYNFGGESSGHIILADHVTTGDGLVAGLQVLAAIRQAQRPASEVCRRFEPLPQLTQSISPASRPTPAALNNLAKTHEARLGERGRIVIRASGTENLVRVMAEGENSTVVRTVVDDLCELLAGNQPANSLAA